MIKDIRVYLDDILESIAHIEAYTKKITEKRFNKNMQLQDAVMRRLEIIGEQRGRNSNTTKPSTIILQFPVPLVRSSSA